MRLRDLFRRAVFGRRNAALEERLRFEALLSELSAGLIHVPAPDLGRALELALQQVGTFLGVDRADLEERAAPGMRIAWARPGLGPAAHVLEAAQYPWTAAKLGLGQLVRFSEPDELAAEAAIDRASYERAGIRSTVTFPLRAGGSILGTLSFTTIRRRHAWSDELVERLHLLSQAFVSALERRRVEEALAERLRFERLLSSLSAAFTHLSAADFDRGVQQGLREVVAFLGVDRGSMVEFSRDGGATHSWGIEEWMDVGQFPWMTARLRRGDVVDFSRPEALSAEAAVDRRSYLAHRVKPQVAVPLLVGGAVVGGLVFSAVAPERARSDTLIQQLNLLAEVFGNALARKQGEIEAQRLRQDLAHIGRVSALGELAASLAHELNQPLTAILSNAQAAQRLLGAGAAELGEVREILDDIVLDDRRASDIIRRLGALVRKGDLELAPLDVNDLVNDVMWLVRSDAAARNIAVRLELAPGLPQVRGDRVQLQQVVLNLVLNALDAMRTTAPGAGALVVRTAPAGAGGVEVAVEDTGSGLDEAVGDRIFKPLYTTRAAGLGMGLAIARTIVGAHGGRLEAANNTTRGATFRFTLPAAAAGGDGP